MTLRPAVLSGLAAYWLASVAWCEPAPPVAASAVDDLQVGVFCALQSMAQQPAPGTLSGWIHVPDGEIDFHWPDRRVVPAALGLAFGVKTRLVPGQNVPEGEMRVFRPESAVPEYWGTSFTDIDDQVSFFRFDDETELIPGIWRFEGWDGQRQLFSVEFEVVPAAALPEIVDACGAVA
jgi:hypothetical protein